MDGAGRSSRPTRRTSRSRRTTAKTASAATSRPRARTGFTFRVIRFSANSEQHVQEPRSNTEMTMQKYVLVTIIGIALVGAGLRSYTASAVAAEGQESAAVLLPDGTAK